LPWLEMEGYTPSAYGGVSFSGVRETRHKEWDPSLLTTDHFAASAVWGKTFQAGTISIPGNNGGDGSFLIFLDRPSAEDEFDSRLSAYWESGNCGVHGNDWNWGWCSNQAGTCPLTVATDLCLSGEAELAVYEGTGEANSYTRDGCNYFWHAQYRCVAHQPVVLGAYTHIHGGHCAGGWLGGNTMQANTDACSAHCRAVDNCHYFAFCGDATDAQCTDGSNCALYDEAGGCPDDDNWGAYEAYVNNGNAPVVSYMKMAYGSANCPEGKRISTYAECEAAHVALGLEIDPVWHGTHDGIPGLCSTREEDWGGGHHFHFNNQAVGVVRADLAPVCRA